MFCVESGLFAALFFLKMSPICRNDLFSLMYLMRRWRYSIQLVILSLLLLHSDGGFFGSWRELPLGFWQWRELTILKRLEISLVS